jgi:hypothetical protein
MMSSIPFRDYEDLVRALIDRISKASTVATDRLEQPKEPLLGATGASHQIDVLWDFTAPNGVAWRLLFEARSYKRSLTQNAVIAFNGVVEDITSIVSDRRCVGVMVTTVDDARKLDSNDARKVNTRRLESDHFGRLGLDQTAGGRWCAEGAYR